MANPVLLEVVSGSLPTGDPMVFTLIVADDWLASQVEGDASEPKWATLVMQWDRIVRWNRVFSGPVPVPTITAFGATVGLVVSYLEDNINSLDLNLSATGTLEAAWVQGHPGFRFRIQSGVFKLWTDRGFIFHSRLFAPLDPGTDLAVWRASIWPDRVNDVAALWFGGESTEIEVVVNRGTAQPRLRLDLRQETADLRLWEQSSCRRLATPTQTPAELLTQLRTRVQAVLDTLPRRAVAVAPRLGADPSSAQVFYEVSRAWPIPATPIRRFARPDFDLLFRDDPATTRWSPRVVTTVQNQIVLHDDPAEGIGTDADGADSGEPVAQIRWERTGSGWSVAEARLPTLEGVGSTSTRLQSGYLWQFAAVAPVPVVAGAEMPGWVRYELPEPDEAAPPSMVVASLDGPLGLPPELGPDGWRLRFEHVARDHAGAVPTGRRVELTVTDGARFGVLLSVFDAVVTAESVPVHVYPGALPAPRQPPNSRRLELDGRGTSGTLATTRLVFTSHKSEGRTSRPKLTATITPGAPVRFGLTAERDAVVAFLPYGLVAGIDPLSAASGNLGQRIDDRTRRVIVERDVSHGLTTWTLRRPFRLAGATDDHPGRLEAVSGSVAVDPVESSVYFAFALAPWVVCRDGLDIGGAAPTRRTLHHRNLVLEHGEFAAASMDRSVDGRPVAIAASRRDFLEAVRDAYSVAVTILPGIEAAAAPVTGWLPGAAIVAPGGNATPGPRAWLETPTAPGSAPLDRLPAVRLAGSTQRLQAIPGDRVPVLGEDLPWLTFDVRWRGWADVDGGRRPRVEVAEPPPRTAPTDGRQRARQSAVPLLFEADELTAAALGGPGATPASPPLLAANGSGRVRLIDPRTGRLRASLAIPGASPPAAVLAVAVGGAGYPHLALAIDAGGRLGAWRLTDVDSDPEAIPVILPAHPCQVAGLGFLNGLAVIVSSDAHATHVWSWDPDKPLDSTNPRAETVAGLGTIASVSISLRSTADGLALAVAPGAGGPPLVLLARQSGSLLTFAPVDFDATPSGGARAVAVHEIAEIVPPFEGEGEVESGDEDRGGAAIVVPRLYLAVIVADGTRCDVHRVEGGVLKVTDSLVPASGVLGDLRRVALGPQAAAAGGHPSPLRADGREVAGLLTLADAAGRVATWYLRPRIGVGSMPPTGRTPLRVHTIWPTALAWLEHTPLAASPEGPARAHLLAGGRDGSLRVIDADAGLVRAELWSDQEWLDGLGVVRATTAGWRPAPGVLVQPLAFPAQPHRPRTDPDSAPGAFGSAIVFDLAPTPDEPDAGLLIAEGNLEDDRTEIRLVCRQLHLTRDALGMWTPLALAPADDLGDERPPLRFPYHVGPVGTFGASSQVAGEVASLDNYPRLGGLPVHVAGIESFRFASTASGDDFGMFQEVRLRVSLLNPLGAAGEPDGPSVLRDETRLPPGATDAATAILTLSRDNRLGRLRVAGLSSAQGAVLWRVPAQAQAPGAGALDGRFTRLAGRLGWCETQRDQNTRSARITLTVDVAASRAGVLGGNFPLSGLTPLLTSFGNRSLEAGVRGFGFEMIHEPDADTSRLGPDIVAIAPDTAWTDARHATAIATVDGFPEALVVATEGPALLWLDLVSGQPWSRAALSAPAASVDGGVIDVPAVLLATDIGLRVWDAGHGAEIPPGRPARDVRPFDRDEPSAIRPLEPVTAVAGFDGVAVTGDAGGGVTVWDALTGRSLAEALPLESAVVRLAACPAPGVGGPAWFLAAADALRPRVVVLQGGSSGLATIAELTQTGGAEPFATVACGLVGADVHLAAAVGPTLSRWRFPAGGGREDLPTATFSSDSAITALAVARDGDLPAFAVVRANGKLSLVTATGTPVPVGDVPGQVAAVAFFATDSGNHWLSVASPGAAPSVRVWHRTRTDGTWRTWTQIDLNHVPAGDERSAATYLKVGREPAVALGPHAGDDGRREITVARLRDGQTVTTIDVTDAEPTLPAGGLAGLTVRAPHAAVALAGQPHAVVVDLRCGATRLLVDLASTGAAACLVRVEGATWMVTAAGRRIEAWDVVSGLPVTAIVHDEPADVLALAAFSNDPADNPRLLVAASDVRVWTPTVLEPFPTASAVTLPTGPASVTSAALANDGRGVVALVGLHDGSSGNDRVEVWDLGPESATRRQAIRATAGLVRFAAVRTPDGLHLALAPDRGPVDVWNLPPSGRLPRLRWQLGGATDVPGPIAGSRDPALPRVFTAGDRGPTPWTLTGVWALDSVRRVRLHALVALLAPGAGHVGRELTATLAQLEAARVDVWIREAAGEPRRRLVPGSYYRGVHGFLAGPVAAGVPEAASVVALWLDGARLVGTLLAEEVVRVPFALTLAASTGAPGRADAIAEVVRLSATPLAPRAANAGPAGTTIVGGRIVATHPRWSRLELHLGEVVIAGPSVAAGAPRRLLVHAVVEWVHQATPSLYPLEIQGPLVVDLTWPAPGATGKIEIVTGTYRVSPFERFPVVPPPGNLALPRPDGLLTELDVVSTRRGDADLSDFFVRFAFTTQGILAKAVRSEQVPVDTCLDDDAVRPLETHPESVATLVHRRALARRLRYRSTTGELLTQDDDRGNWQPTPSPARASRWLIAPVLRESRVYRLVRQTQVLAPPSTSLSSSSTGNLASEAGPLPRTENLFLLARPFADHVDGSGLLTCLESVTGESMMGPLLAESRILAELEGVLASGVIVHRVLRGGQPATYRIVVREPRDELPAAAPVERVAHDVARPDFRALAPGVALRQTQIDEEYIPSLPVSEPALDFDRTAWRRLRFVDPREVDGPRRPDHRDPSRRAVFVGEQTAFHHLPMPALVPASGEFGLQGTDGVSAAMDDGSAWFHPRGFGLRLGPDKPGAMMHHRVAPLTAPAAPSIDPPAAGALTVFAQREPMQTTPPPGADLVIESATRYAIRGLQADRLTTAWVETLGRLPCPLAAPPAALIEQVLAGNPPPPGRVEVRFTTTELPFARIFLRINEDLLELDSREARLPIYDGRQAATTVRALSGNDAQFFEVGQTATSPPRPDAPALEEEVATLDALSTDLGGLVLAASETKLKVWAMATPQAPLRELTHPGGGPLRGVLTLRDRRAHLLCTTDGTDVGLFLIPIAGQDPAIPLVLPAGEVRDLATVSLKAIVKNASDVEVELDVVAIAALVFDDAAGKTRLRVWLRSEPAEDGTRIDATLDREVDGDGEGMRLARAVTLQRVTEAGASHQRAVFATIIGAGRTARTVAWELDPSQDTDSRTFGLPLPGADPETFAVGAWRAEPTREESLIFAVAEATELVGVELATGLTRKRLNQPVPPVHLAAIVTDAGLLLVVVQNSGRGSADAFQTTLWDVESERPLRTLRPASPTDAGYGRVVPVGLVRGLNLAASRPSPDGTLQVFDAGLEAYAPPEIFFATKLNRPFDPVTVRLKYTADNAVQEQDVTFTPQLIHDSKGFPTRLHRTSLAQVFHPDDEAGGQGVRVWTFAIESGADPTRVDLNWGAANKAWFAWSGILEHNGETFVVEARMLEPSPFKTVNPIPYSAVAPKLAAVVLIDRIDAMRREILQRTIFLGDAAGGTGRPRVVSGLIPQFAYELRDQETVDVPLPALPDSALLVGLALVKSFVNGQVLAAQAFPVQRSAL
ncbi:hypothetical protein EP7_001928 [Isosphaeraceae bacterium EP7]